MKSISVCFHNDIYAKLKSTAENKGVSLNQYIRDLVDIGLRIEEMKNENKEEEALTDTLKLIKKMLEKELASTQETLYLTRYLVTKTPGESSQQNSKILSEAKIRAEGFSEALLGEKEESHEGITA